MRYFARESELAQIHEVAASNSSSGLIIRGPAGSGKSTLLRTAAQDSSIEVVKISANRSECDWPLSGLSVLLSHFGSSNFQDIVGRLGTQEFPSDDILGLSNQLLKCLSALPASGALLLIDDVDHLDETSQEILGFVFRRLSSTNVTAVISLTNSTTECPFEGLPVLDLEPLDRHTIKTLTMSEADIDTDFGTHHIIGRFSEGVPGRAMDMLRGLTPGQISGLEPVQLPFRLSKGHSASLLKDLESVSTEGIKLLRLAAMSTALSVTAASAIVLDCSSALDELYANEYLARNRTGVALRSPALRSALYWSMTAQERLNLSTALQDACTGSEQIWHRSFLAQDSETSTDLYRSAQERLEHDDICGAVEMAERGCAMQFPGQNYSRELANLAESFTKHGELGYGRRYTELAALRSSNKRISFKVARQRILLEFLESGTVPDYLAPAASSQRSDDPDDNDMSELRLLLAVLHLDRWELHQAKKLLDMVQAACDRNEKAEAPMFQAAKNLYSMVTGTNTADALDRLDIPTDDYLTWEPGAVIVQSVAMTYAERYEMSRKILDLLISRSARIGALWVNTAKLYQVMNDLRGGNALAAMESMKRNVQSSQDVQYQALPRTYLKAWYWGEQGNVDRTSKACNAALALAAGRRNPRLAVVVDGHYGAMLLHRGETKRGLRHLLHSYESLAMPISPQAARVEPDLVEALVMTGDICKANRVLEGFRTRAATLSSRWCKLVLARMDALVAFGEESLVLFEKAVALTEPSDSKFEAAKTLSAYAGRLSESGYSCRAQEASTAAATLFDEIGLKVWARSLRERMSAPGVTNKQHIFGRLTKPQREVAELVVAGYRNKEIASKLFTSVRTVEVRLTSIYRQLGVTSRSQLIAAAT